MSEEQQEMITLPSLSTPSQETPTTPGTTPQRQPNYGLFFTVVVPIVSYLISFLSPSPFKEWGLLGVLVSLGALAHFRTIEEFFGRAPAKATLPYSIATFLAVVPFAVWGRGPFQELSLIVFGILVGAAIFYAIVKIIVDEVSKLFRQ